MSLEVTAAVYGALVGGMFALVGMFAGVLTERRLQRRGKVRCVASDWRLTFHEMGPLDQAICSFEADLFNERLLPTGLRGLSVAFVQDDKQEIIVPLRRRLASDEAAGVLNLPPRLWVHASLYSQLEGEEARKLSDFWRSDLVGHFPDGTEFRQKIIVRKDFVASRKRFVATRNNFVAARKRFAADRKNYARPWWRALFGG